KQRFALSADGARIRANQGHSIVVDLDLSPIAPPPVLFHGTATRFLDAILTDGLQPGDRNHVHLSGDVETATAVGRRHGTATVLTVDSETMHRHGRTFFRSENGVWLTDSVPARYLTADD
ncbi:MAG: RNA 2'-phosphotransferase, partial [Acidimicrobiales bacterium]